MENIGETEMPLHLAAATELPCTCKDSAAEDYDRLEVCPLKQTPAKSAQVAGVF